MRGQICLHVVFGEREARPGDPIRAGAAETRKRSRAGGVFIVVMGPEHFDAVPVVEAFRGEVDAGRPRATAHNAGHAELRVVGE